MKKTIAVVCTAILLVSTGASAATVEYGAELKNMPERSYEQKFKDVPKEFWAFSYIAELVEDNVFSGYPDNTFKPNNDVTRAEFAKIMICAAGLEAKNSKYSSFNDVSVSDWYSPYIETAKEFLTGYEYESGPVYLPKNNAIREDIAVALVKLKGYDTSVADLAMLEAMFTDYDSISESAKKYVAVAVERGLVSGYENGTFRGQQSVTRAEAATMIWRAKQYGNDNKLLANNSSTKNSETKETVKIEADEPEQKEFSGLPYRIDTLAYADATHYTYDGKDLYYIEDKTVNKLNIETGETEVVFDAEDLTLKAQNDEGEETKEYSDYTPKRLAYDESADRIIMSGYFSCLNEKFKTPKNDLKEYVAFDLSTEEMFLFIDEIESIYPMHDCVVECVLKNGNVFLLPDWGWYQGTHFKGIYNINTQKAEYISGYADYNPVTFVNNNKIYMLSRELHEFSFSDKKFIPVIGWVWYDVFYGYDGDGNIYYKENKNSSMIKMSLDGDVKELDIGYSEDICEIVDMLPCADFNKKIIPINEDCIILYDNSAMAFRKLEKNY